MQKLIVPAILTKDKDELLRMAAICGDFCKYLQIDVMDGEFVSSKSIAKKDLENLKLPLSSEAHLMVNEPLEWLETFKRIGSKRIIFHFEIKNNHIGIIKAIKKQGLEAGLAINPATKISDFAHLVDNIDSILFMSVIPGFYGSLFIPEVLKKVTVFKKLYPEKYTGIDGGVRADNIIRVAESGVDYICIGSAVLKAENPKVAYLKIKKLLDE